MPLFNSLRRALSALKSAWTWKSETRSATGSNSRQLGGHFQAFLASTFHYLFRRTSYLVIAPLPTDSSVKIASEEEVRNVRDVIASFVRRCDIPFPTVEFDHQFDTTCRADAIRRGYPMEGPNSLAPFIAGGVAMATTAYAHLTNKSTQILISLYTAFLIYTDDIFQHNIDAVREFNERFVLREPQEDKVLECFAKLLLELPDHFSRVSSNLMITSTLNLVTALLLEYETRGMALRTDARGYPTFSRILSGASEAYALFGFLPELAVPTYIQALPELMIYINNGNDILSFYKEELARESVNRVSLLAALHGTSKYRTLRHLADDAVDAHMRILQILKPQKAALDAYRSFAKGYIGFHAALPRYKLRELDLQVVFDLRSSGAASCMP